MKIAIIICWFGPFPNYFSIWEKSCSLNENYNFLIFTDQQYKSKYKNIKIINKNLNDMNSFISKKLNLQTKIEKPYKFCDFRPAFGIIFEEYLKGYDFWGHCDLDQVFGRIDDFININILKNYERINRNGHLSLYKNDKKINNLFKKEGSLYEYKDVFSNNENYAFDEFTGINLICKNNDIKEYYINDYADIDVKHKRYRCFNRPNYKRQIYVWDNGKLIKYFFAKKELKEESLMYIHFQKKKPNLRTISNNTRYAICSCGIVSLDSTEITKEMIDKLNKQNYILEKFEIIKYYIKKITDFIKCSKKQKKIWINQVLIRNKIRIKI